jgi:hypothetical protein
MLIQFGYTEETVLTFDSKWSLEVAVVLDPLVPLHTVPIDQSIAFELGSFGVKDVPSLTARVLDPPLFRLVETVKSGREGVVQISDVSCRVKRPPWLCARLALARLQDEQEGV